MVNEDQIDPRLEGFKQYLDEQISGQMGRPYSERENIEKTLTVYEDGMKIYDKLIAIPDLILENSELYNESVSCLKLSVRSRKSLGRANIKTLGELIEKTPEELLGLKNFGITCLNELRISLESKGLSVAGE